MAVLPPEGDYGVNRSKKVWRPLTEAQNVDITTRLVKGKR
jgi:hypothetical protein